MKELKCDMRGMLSFMILWLLTKKKMHGQEIAKEIQKRKGEKPKTSTLYPALKQLSEKGLIKGEKKGRQIVYSLTNEGEKTIKKAVQYFSRAFKEIIENS